MKKLLVSVLVLGLGVSTAAMAQSATDFAIVDADASGDVSLTEAQAIWPDLSQEAYAAADTDQNGSLNQAEYEALLAAIPPA
jgi:Skp family chaperone for outer membrane proteins